MDHLDVVMTTAFVLRGSGTGDASEIIVIEEPTRQSYRVLIRGLGREREINTGAATATDDDRRVHDAIAARDWNSLMRLISLRDLDELERALGIARGNKKP